MNQEMAIRILVLLSVFSVVHSSCSRGCGLALGSYRVWRGSTLTVIADLMETTVAEILSYNPQIVNRDSVPPYIRIRMPFSSCDCINGEFLGKVFKYKLSSGDTYDVIASTYYSNLTTASWLQRFNVYSPTELPDADAYLNVTLNCSCGNRAVSKDYGLFLTYPLQPGENLTSVADSAALSAALLQRYNPNSDFRAGSGLVYIPTKDTRGSYRGLKHGFSRWTIGGISAVGVVIALLLTACIFYRKRKEATMLLTEKHSIQPAHAPGNTSDKAAKSTGPAAGGSAGLKRITVEKSVEFSYEELAKATDNFNLDNKIGEGAYGSVYYAELRGEKTAIKKMDMQASREFLAELKVLTHVHHLNLVRLIGYCVEGSLFIVYEYIENGNLSQHLRGSGRDPLPWSTRVQIALDSARGLEYIHEHTVPVYIHFDVKSANLLIDNNFHAKVADFGLTRLTKVGRLLVSRVAGTFGYMPPEYVRCGHASPKVDVFAFGVVLYELISAKAAVVRENGSVEALVAMFENVLNQPDLSQKLHKLVDPNLGDYYSLDSVHKMALLAKACTLSNPKLRPTMRSIVIALMTLSSALEKDDAGSLEEFQALINQISGRGVQEAPPPSLSYGGSTSVSYQGSTSLSYEDNSRSLTSLGYEDSTCLSCQGVSAGKKIDGVSTEC